VTTKSALPFLVLLVLPPAELLAQPAAPRPLIWAADFDGGIPYVFRDRDGKLAGFEVDLRDALARELGRPIEFKQYAFDSLFAGVERGDFDFAMNGLEITAERQQLVRFTRPYYIYQLQLVARQRDDRIRSLEDCKDKGLTVATLAGSAAERLLDDRGIAKRIYDDQDGPYKDLQLGRGVDAGLLDLPVALYYAVRSDLPASRAHQFPGLRLVGAPFAEGYYAIAVRNDNAALAAALDTAIDRILRSGELKRILARWELWNPDQYRLYDLAAIEAGTPHVIGIGVYLPLLLEGAGMTVLLTLAGMALAVLLGLPIAALRLYGPAPLRWLAVLYVEFFRGIPVLLLLYFLYFGLPALVPGLELNAVTAAILAFGLNYAAYEAEVYRAGIGAIPAGQWEAAASLAMPPLRTFRRIIVPQALRVIIPPMTNDLIALFKDTSVVSIIAVVELSKQYQILTKSGAGYLQVGLTTALLYLVMSVPLGHLSRYLERRWGGAIP
jgi:polar amino acid transport system substrate-binding protein